MSDARQAFRDLHEVAGQVFDTTELRADPVRVEERVSRYRAGRAVLASFAGIGVAGVVVAGALQALGAAEVSPATSPTPPPIPQPTDIVTDARDPACADATVVPGAPAGDVGGLEGWWNATPIAPCDEWNPAILAHPDTVTINTSDGTMLEASYRTSLAALGVYADLGPDFRVPDPDPEWPAASIIVIDAATGEVLSSSRISELHGQIYSAAEIQLDDPGFYKVERPYPAGAVEPTLEDLWPRAAGAEVLWEDDKVVRFLSGEAQPGEFSVVKADASVYAARDWQCAWLREYLWGAGAGDAERVSTALGELERFSQLDAIANYQPELGEQLDEVLLEPLRTGDTSEITSFVSRSC